MGDTTTTEKVCDSLFKPFASAQQYINITFATMYLQKILNFLTDFQWSRFSQEYIS